MNSDPRSTQHPKQMAHEGEPKRLTRENEGLDKIPFARLHVKPESTPLTTVATMKPYAKQWARRKIKKTSTSRCPAPISIAKNVLVRSSFWSSEKVANEAKNLAGDSEFMQRKKGAGVAHGAVFFDKDLTDFFNSSR